LGKNTSQKLAINALYAPQEKEKSAGMLLCAIRRIFPNSLLAKG